MSDRDGSIVFQRTLPLAREAAFDLLVDHIGDWWPRDLTFSRDPAADLSIEPVAGGACAERLPGGTRIVWGTVLSIERPLYLRLAWQISFDRKPVPDPAAASRVMIEFRQMADGTRIELTHGDFLRHGEDAIAYREAMASAQGWPACLDALEAAARVRPARR